MNKSLFNIIHQILFYISAVVFVWSIFFHTYYALLAVIYSWFVGTMVVSCYYHRYLSHKSWNCPRWLEKLLLLLGAGHGFMPAFSWTNIHLRHHKFHDTEKDPHGPHLSIFKNLNLAMHHINIKFVRRYIYENRLVMFQLKHYWKILIIYFFVWSYFLSPLLWFNINGCVFLGLVAVNMTGHKKNYGPINRNLTPIVVAGETYHENHHRSPGTARFGLLDPGWWFIKLFHRA